VSAGDLLFALPWIVLGVAIAVAGAYCLVGWYERRHPEPRVPLAARDDWRPS
jgi:hypothetical protein